MKRTDSASSPPAPHDVVPDFEALEGLYARITALLELPFDRLDGVQEERSAWSPAQHLFHVLLANELSLKNVLALRAGEGLLVRPFEEQMPEAEELLVRGTFPRGQTRAPRIVTPPPRVDPEVLADVFRSTVELLARVRSLPEDLGDPSLCVPHQALGQLDGSRWVRFVHIHTAHHAGIVQELLDAASQ